MEEQDNKRVRIFVGGLGEAVTTDDLRRLFGSLGSVEGVETIRTKGRSFAYVDFVPSPTDLKSLSKLFSKYNGCLWKGGKLKLEKAKEDYLVRLKREWEEDAAAPAADEVVSVQPGNLNLGPNKLETMPNMKESSKTKQLHIFFPRLKKVKSIPFNGTGKHKYSFQNIKVPSLPVHFCDCEEHCSSSGTERGKISFDGPTESGGMNDEEINIMNAVMNKLFEKEKVSDSKHLEKEQDSFESPDALHSDECDLDSATDEDDLIINMETKKNKAALTGSQELERILGSQELLLNKTRIAKEEPKRMVEVQKSHISNPNKKRKSLPKLERESNGCVTTTPGGKSNKQTLPNEMGSGMQPAKLEDGFGESTKVLWSQKSSWRKLLGDGGNTAFNASLILPKFDSGQDQQRSDRGFTPLSTNDKTENMERDKGVIKELAEAHPTNKQVIEEHAGAQPTDKNVAPNKTGRGASWLQKQSCKQLVGEKNKFTPLSTDDKTENMERDKRDDKTENMERDKGVIKEHAEAHPTNKQVIEEHAGAEPTDKNVAPNNTGRGASWLQEQSWTQLVGENNNPFSISQILPGITFPEPMTKEPIVDPANSNDCKHNDVAKATINEVVCDGSNLGEKNQNVGANGIAAAPIVEKKIETRPRDISIGETIPKEPMERSTEDVEIGETCSFMRNASSLREWAKAKAALSGSLKRKRSEK